MPLLFDPLYPNQVQYVVSKWIWDLYEIHLWQVLFRQWGKTKTFHVLRQRYEKKHYEFPALLFMVTVFALSFLIQYLMILRQRNAGPVVPPELIAPPPQQNNVVDNQNPDNRDGNQEPDHNQ